MEPRSLAQIKILSGDINISVGDGTRVVNVPRPEEEGA